MLYGIQTFNFEVTNFIIHFPYNFFFVYFAPEIHLYLEFIKILFMFSKTFNVIFHIKILKPSGVYFFSV